MTAGRPSLAGVCLLVGLAAPGPAGAAPAQAAGEAIYLRGTLGSGAPLEGVREADTRTRGADAACVNCHQRSGLGSIEGSITIPPITGQYLFRPLTQEDGAPVLPYVETARGDRAPYTDETLARAIRDGLDPEGRPLADLMPRFALGDADMAALIGYLKRLGPAQVPGVRDGVVHFATVVTPDADPVKRRGVISVLEEFFAQKNRAPLKPAPAMRTSGRTQFSKSMYVSSRRWELHVWELEGDASTWRAQLDARLVAEPVYAVLSGLGGSNWRPVHEFCEAHALPCLFPNVEVPVVAESDFYSVYFSRGVLLEARLMARALLGVDGDPAVRAVEQVYRAGDSGAPAAAALAREVEGHGVAVHATVLPARARAADVAAAVRRIGRQAGSRGGALVLWLRPADLAALDKVRPPGPVPVYLSGLMGGLEGAPLPPRWRAHARMAYPFDLPDRRGVRLDYPLGWLSFRHVPLVAEQVQTDTYLACNLVADVMNRMADNTARAYLIEQLQEQLEHRLITGYYPHLALATNQHFASKGGYLVRFRDVDGPALVPEGDWIVP